MYIINAYPITGDLENPSVFPVQPENFRAVAVEKLRFFLVQP